MPDAPFRSIPFRCAPSPPPPKFSNGVHRLRPGQQLLQLQLDTTCYSCLLCRCVRVCVRACVYVCVLNIAIYHANAFFNFNMPPGIIKTLQTHNMSQEPRAVEKRHGGKLSPQMMGYHRLHGAKICLIRSSDNILFQFTPASYRTYHIQFSS